MTKPRKQTITTLRRQLKTAMQHVAAERDKLRDLSDELDALLEDTGEAMEHLENAADALSRLV